MRSICDGNGVPLAVTMTGGNRNDVTQLMPLLGAIPPERGKVGRPRQRPTVLYADRGYDHDKYRRLVWKKGIRPYIARRGAPHGSGLGVPRWVVEQSIALLHWFRRLRVHLHHRFQTETITADTSLADTCVSILAMFSTPLSGNWAVRNPCGYAVVAMIAVLGVILSGLASGLADSGISSLRALPLTHLAFDKSASGELFSRSTVTQNTWRAWAGQPGVRKAEPLGQQLVHAQLAGAGSKQLDLAVFGAQPGGFLAPAPLSGKPLSADPNGILVSEEIPRKASGSATGSPPARRTPP